MAAEYGEVLEPVNYIRGVAISGRLRLHRLDPATPDPAPSIAEVVGRLLSPESLAELARADGSVHAGFVWADELTEATGDRRYIDALLRIADRYLQTGADGLPVPIDADDRVEEIFFAAALLGRTYYASRNPPLHRHPDQSARPKARSTRQRALVALQGLALLLGQG